MVIIIFFLKTSRVRNVYFSRDTSNWKNIQKLVSHNLTVTQISFSPDSQKILTVSRDRRWSVFEKNGQGQFILAATTNKANGVHARIIWCCSWTHDSKFFATGSRDGEMLLFFSKDQVIGFSWKNILKKNFLIFL